MFSGSILPCTTRSTFEFMPVGGAGGGSTQTAELEFFNQLGKGRLFQDLPPSRLVVQNGTAGDNGTAGGTFNQPVLVACKGIAGTHTFEYHL